MYSLPVHVIADPDDAVPGFLDGRDVPREMIIDLGEG
jgi:hypothetical protein